MQRSPATAVRRSRADYLETGFGVGVFVGGLGVAVGVGVHVGVGVMVGVGVIVGVFVGVGVSVGVGGGPEGVEAAPEFGNQSGPSLSGVPGAM
mgnify:CR=1 FL=1